MGIVSNPSRVQHLEETDNRSQKQVGTTSTSRFQTRQDITLIADGLQVSIARSSGEVVMKFAVANPHLLE